MTRDRELSRREVQQLGAAGLGSSALLGGRARIVLAVTGPPSAGGRARQRGGGEQAVLPDVRTIERASGIDLATRTIRAAVTGSAVVHEG